MVLLVASLGGQACDRCEAMEEYYVHVFSTFQPSDGSAAVTRTGASSRFEFGVFGSEAPWWERAIADATSVRGHGIIGVAPAHPGVLYLSVSFPLAEQDLPVVTVDALETIASSSWDGPVSSSLPLPTDAVGARYLSEVTRLQHRSVQRGLCAQTRSDHDRHGACNERQAASV